MITLRYKGVTLFIAVVLTLTFWNSSASLSEEDYSSGNAVLHDCEAYLREGSTGELVNQGYCLGFVYGIWTTGLIFNVIHRDDPKVIGVCTPPNGTLGQIIRVFVKFAHDHPERLHERAEVLVLDSLRQAFPCSEFQ